MDIDNENINDQPNKTSKDFLHQSCECFTNEHMLGINYHLSSYKKGKVNHFTLFDLYCGLLNSQNGSLFHCSPFPFH